VSLQASPTHLKGLEGVPVGPLQLIATGTTVSVNGHELATEQLSSPQVLSWREVTEKGIWRNAADDHYYLILGTPQKPIVLDFESDKAMAELVARAADLAVAGPDSRRQALLEERRLLQTRRRTVQRWTGTYTSFGILLVVAGFALLLVPDLRRLSASYWYLPWIMLAYGFLALLSRLTAPIREMDLRLQEIKEELELLDIGADTQIEARSCYASVMRIPVSTRRRRGSQRARRPSVRRGSVAVKFAVDPTTSTSTVSNDSSKI
jgi:hypothetical protein